MGTDAFAGNTVVIDLGLNRGEPETYASPGRPTVSGWFAPLMVGLLVLISSVASAAPPPPALTPLLSLRVGPADSFALTEDRELLAQTDGTISAYNLADGALRWQSGSERPSYRLRTANELVLMRPWTYGPGEPSTTALSLTTGLPQWRHEGTMMSLEGSPALLAVSAVRSGGTNRRVQGTVESINPRTGAARWRVTIPSTAVLLGIPGPADEGPRMMLLHDDRVAVVHDLSTGAELTRTELPPANYGPENPTISGGLILLRHLGRYGPDVTAYDPVTLRQVWERSAERAFDVRPCGPLACLTSPDGVRGIDPANGQLRWYRKGWRGVEWRNGMMLAYVTPAGVSEPVGIVDPLTAEIQVKLDGWRLVGGAGGDHLLVTRAVVAGARTMVAVAGPAVSSAPLPLAELPAGTGDCQAVPNRLVCRSTSGELQVWAYRKKV